MCGLMMCTVGLERSVIAIKAKVIVRGRSLVFRLPKTFRLQATVAEIEQIGNYLWVHPITSKSQNMGLWLQQFYAETESLPPDFMSDRGDVGATQ